MSEELRRCPFCGGKAILIRDSHGDFRCGCEENCNLTYPDRDEAVDEWNARPIEEALRAELATANNELRMHRACDLDKAAWIAREQAIQREIARKGEEIKALEELIEELEKTGGLWAEENAARARLAEVRGEGKP